MADQTTSSSAYRDPLAAQWKAARPVSVVPFQVGKHAADALAISAKEHRMLLMVLGFTVLGLCLFFGFLLPVTTTTLFLIATCMIGPTVLRFGVELRSLYLLNRVVPTALSVDYVDRLHSFLAFRRIVRFPLTVLTISIYSVGFAVLLIAFAPYTTTLVIVGLALFYLIGMVTLRLVSRKAINRENQALAELTKIKEDLMFE